MPIKLADVLAHFRVKSVMRSSLELFTQLRSNLYLLLPDVYLMVMSNLFDLAGFAF